MKVDNVVKLGGSLLYDMDKTRKLLERLDKGKNCYTVYTIGSGYLGEVYKKWVNEDCGIQMPFENSVSIWANIQSINANILAGINPNFVVCDSKESISEAFSRKKRPILDAKGFLEYYRDETYENQTSDVRSAILCNELGCKALTIITDVDGIFSSDPRKNSESRRFERINARDLQTMGRTSVDKGLAEKLIQFDITGYVVGIDSLIKQEKSNERIEGIGTVIEH